MTDHSVARPGNPCQSNKRFLISSLGSALLLFSTTGMATDTTVEEMQPRQYLAPQFFYLVPDDDRDIDRSGQGVGLRYGRQLTDHLWWETEGAAYTLESGVDNGADFYQHSLTTGLMYTLGNRKSFTPYAVGALGVLHNDVVPDSNDAYDFHANLGAGLVTGPLFDNGLKLRAEARYLYDDFEASNDQTGDNGGYGDWRFSLGLEVPLGYTRVREVEVEKVVYKTREVEKVVETPVVDSDGDTVPDNRDQCPDTLKNAEVNAQGCMISNQTITLNNINFELNAATLSANSRYPLDQMARTLQSQQDFQVEIAGHSDSTGAAAYNRTLSRKRAQAVRDYLIRKGVNAGRLTARGYGESQPIASNDSTSGRAMNRRVEFRLSQQQEPHHDE